MSTNDWDNPVIADEICQEFNEMKPYINYPGPCVSEMYSNCLRAPYTLEDISKFESKNNVSIPYAFKKYLTSVSSDTNIDSYIFRVSLNQDIQEGDCPYSDSSNFECDATFDSTQDCSCFRGTMCVGDGGCDNQVLLILRGPKRGYVLRQSTPIPTAHDFENQTIVQALKNALRKVK